MCKIIILLALMNTPQAFVERIEPEKCDMHVRLFNNGGALTLSIMGMTETRDFKIPHQFRCCDWRFVWREGWPQAKMDRISMKQEDVA